jgi:shikimate dehydrogenase
MTKRLRFVLLGHPVAHSISPAICSAAFHALGLPHLYSTLDVPGTPELRTVLDDIRSGRFAGANVTLPYKTTAFDMADVVAESASAVGAANVIAVDRNRRLVAHNTDADALFAELSSLLVGRPKSRVAIIGGGGAALAALVACKRLGFQIVCMTSRSWINSETMFDSPTAERARSLGALTSLWPRRDEPAASSKGSQVLRLQWTELAAQADCVIQATSAGMVGADPGEEVCDVLSWDRLPAHALAYDVVYIPRVTPFLRRAQAHGLRAAGGLGMLARQAQIAVNLWLGQTPPLDVMRIAADAALGPISTPGIRPPQDTIPDDFADTELHPGAFKETE